MRTKIFKNYISFLAIAGKLPELAGCFASSRQIAFELCLNLNCYYIDLLLRFSLNYKLLGISAAKYGDKEERLRLCGGRESMRPETG